MPKCCGDVCANGAATMNSGTITPVNSPEMQANVNANAAEYQRRSSISGSISGSPKPNVKLNVDTKVARRDMHATTAREGKGAGHGSLELEKVVAKGIRLVVLDFDQCILAIHSYALRITPEAVLLRQPFSADFCDLEFFVNLVRALIDRGIHVAVASFGRYEVIQTYMDRAFGAEVEIAGAGSKLFTRANISTPSCVGGKDGYSVQGGKNPQLAALAEQYGCGPANVMFFDDDENNIRLALECGYRYSIACPSGFDGAAWSAGLSALAAPTPPHSALSMDRPIRPAQPDVNLRLPGPGPHPSAGRFVAELSAVHPLAASAWASASAAAAAAVPPSSSALSGPGPSPGHLSAAAPAAQLRHEPNLSSPSSLAASGFGSRIGASSSTALPTAAPSHGADCRVAGGSSLSSTSDSNRMDDDDDADAFGPAGPIGLTSPLASQQRSQKVGAKTSDG